MSDKLCFAQLKIYEFNFSSAIEHDKPNTLMLWILNKIIVNCAKMPNYLQECVIEQLQTTTLHE